MLDFSHIATPYGSADVQIFTGTSPTAGSDWLTWVKPRGKTMMDLFLIGKGGNGGPGAIGTGGGGGGGGGSGGQVRVIMPLHMVPDRLYLSLVGVGTASGSAGNSFVCIAPKLTAGAGAPIPNNNLAYVVAGTVGSNGTAGGAGGAGGGAGLASVGNTMPLGWNFALAVGGQAGTAGGTGATTGAAGTALVLPVSGGVVCGGTGGGGCPATTGNGLAGGAVPATGMFPDIAGGVGGLVGTPPTKGNGVYRQVPGVGFWLPGTGGGGCYSSAQQQASGGNGDWGCGGGGSGGYYTGGTAGIVGNGGPSICIITCW